MELGTVPAAGPLVYGGMKSTSSAPPETVMNPVTRTLVKGS